MAVDIIARGMAGNGGSGGVDQSYVDAQDRKTLNDAKSYTNETAIDYIGREQQIDFNATLEGNIITATLDETVSDFTFTNNTGYLFHIYLPLVTLTGTLDNSYEIILKDKDNNTININCMFQKDITKTSTVGDLCQIQDYDTGIGYSWEFYGNYREITENGTLIREVYTDTVVRETNPSMTGQDLHLAIVNSKLKVGTVVMCTTNYENNGSAYYAGRTYKINGDYSTGELILSAEDITVNTFSDISVENVVSRNKAGLKEIAWMQSIDYINTTSNGVKYKAKAEQYAGFNLILNKSLEIGKEYTISFKNSSSDNITFGITKTNTGWQNDYDNSYIKSHSVNANASYSYTFTAVSNIVGIMFICSIVDTADTNERNIIDIQVEEGPTATSYVPYLNLEELQEKTNDTGWIELSLINGATSIENDRKLSYRKIGNIVYLSGTIIPPETASSSAVIIAYLPSGCRPHYTYESFIIRNNNGSCIAGINFSTIDGAIWIQNATNGETSFSNVSFIADN